MTGPPAPKRPLEAGESSGKKPKRLNLENHPVDVRVGTGADSERFHCFAPLLRQYSRHFRSELEGKTDDVGPDDLPSYSVLELSLPSEKPSDFWLFREYMENPRFFGTADEVRTKRAFDLARLFCFAHRIGALQLKNVCIDCLYLKTQQSALRLRNPGKRNSEEPAMETIRTWKRTARWVLNHPDIHPESSGLYKFVTDFFAFFVLQMVPLLEESVISDLPNSFLWHILCALENALARHVPGLPASTTPPSTRTAPPSTSAATGTSAVTTVARDNGKVVTVVQIDESDNEKDTLLVPSGNDVTTGPTAAAEKAALGTLPKKSLITKILLLAGILRALVDGTLQKPQPPKKRGRPSRKKKGCDEDDSDDDSTADGAEEHEHERSKKQPTRESAFFGVSNLCKYHYHSSTSSRNRCEQRFEAVSTNEVWPMVPDLRR